MSNPSLRLAVWSGPRNISTALMRSFGNRADTAVCDEPLYAHYLKATSLPHPGREEVLAHHESDWRKVVAWLTGPVPEQRTIFYQKHMSHHLLPSIERDWLWQLEHAFLIRDPREMLISLAKITPAPRLADTGLPQQVEIFEELRRRSRRPPPIVDAKDLQNHPEPMLRQLCAALGIEFAPAMLSWPPGPRSTDGVWAKHWYAAVERSSAFEPWKARDEALPKELEALHRDCLALHEALYARRLRP